MPNQKLRRGKALQEDTARYPELVELFGDDEPALNSAVSLCIKGMDPVTLKTYISTLLVVSDRKSAWDVIKPKGTKRWEIRSLYQNMSKMARQLDKFDTEALASSPTNIHWRRFIDHLSALQENLEPCAAFLKDIQRLNKNPQTLRDGWCNYERTHLTREVHLRTGTYCDKEVGTLINYVQKQLHPNKALDHPTRAQKAWRKRKHTTFRLM